MEHGLLRPPVNEKVLLTGLSDLPGRSFAPVACIKGTGLTMDMVNHVVV